MKLLDKINKAARDWERTKDLKYKKEWYRLCRVFANVALNKKSNADAKKI